VWVAGRVGPTVPGRFPVVIKLHVNSVHATCRVGGRASCVTLRECVERCIGDVHAGWVCAFTVYRVIHDRIVFVLEVHPLDLVNLYKR
jgi:hypothetical protein